MGGLGGRIAIGIVVIIVLLAGAAGAMRWLWPSVSDRRPALVEMRPLAPVTRSSRIVMPAEIMLTAIRDAMEQSPREGGGKLDIASLMGGGAMGGGGMGGGFGPPGGGVFGPPGGGGPGGAAIPGMPEITWSLERGPFALSGRSDELLLSTSLKGGLKSTGGAGGGAPFGPPGFGPPGFRPPGFGGPGGQAGARDQRGGGQGSEQRVDVSGSVQLSARPSLQANWRIDPNLVAQVSIADASLQIMGMRMNLSNDMKPTVERTINEQVTNLQSRIRDDDFIEKAARDEWAKACRSISLGAAAPGAPNLWLEVRPTRAFAAQPRIDQSAMTLTFGIEAETRIVPSETRPTCAFPAQLELVSQMERGRVSIAVPIDVPFTEIKRLMEQQLVGKSMPLDRGGSVTATVRGVDLAASDGRLLISLRVKANENKSWFGLSGEVTVHVWGRPVLDRAQQVLRIENISLDAESDAAFGALGVAARAALPYLEKPITENSTIDLKPIAATARKNIETAVAEFQKTSPGVRADTSIDDLRLGGIEFDSKVLRVIAEAEGTVRITVTQLPPPPAAR
ncbi:MAG: DUF4403 family protein [Hyphomicrobiales bacterium]|nr:DUF4403 family protein [Hyphomicrobiales bacterium]